MSKGEFCKNCPRFTRPKNWCDRFGKYTTPWTDWCEPRKADYEAWKLEGCK